MGVYVDREERGGWGVRGTDVLQAEMFTAIALVFKYITLRLTLNC